MDWNGASRFSSTQARGLYSQGEYSPFGVVFDKSTPYSGPIFDEVGSSIGGEYETWARELNATQGRWIQPDPAGLAAVDITNPQSWNRYAYVLNNPLSFVDPLGLYCEWDPDASGRRTNDSTDDPDTGTQKKCEALGGNWVPDNGVYTEAYLGPGNDAPTIQAQSTACPTGSCDDWEQIPANNFTLGLRQPGQTFNQCMQANARNYSLLGVADFATGANGQIADNVWLGFTPASNTITSIYNAAAGSLTSLFQTGPTVVTAGMGTVLTSGRRTSSIMSLNLPGTPGGSARGTPALGSAPSNAARAGKVAAAALKIAIDAGFFLAEGAGCAGPMNY